MKQTQVGKEKGHPQAFCNSPTVSDISLALQSKMNVCFHNCTRLGAMGIYRCYFLFFFDWLIVFVGLTKASIFQSVVGLRLCSPYGDVMAGCSECFFFFFYSFVCINIKSHRMHFEHVDGFSHKEQEINVRPDTCNCCFISLGDSNARTTY